MYISSHYQPDFRALSCDMVRGGRHVAWNHENLSSPVWRYYWMPKPHAWLWHGSQRLQPGPEEVLLIPPNTPFGTRCDEPLEQFVAHFLLAPPFDSVKPDIFVVKANGRTRELLKEIIALAEAGGPFDMRLALLTLELCLQALNSIPAGSLVFRKDDRQVSEAMRKIRASPGGRQTVARMAEEAGMSANSFIRRFKAQAGETPQRYLMRAKIEAACLLLWRPGKPQSIDEIAEALGFCNRNHFTQAFIKQMGVGPAKYRDSAPASLGA